LNLRLFFLY